MTFKEFVPAGTPGTDLASAGTNLQAAVVTGASTQKYTTRAGLGRDAVGVDTNVTVVTDTAYATLRNTQLAAGLSRVYLEFHAYPTGTLVQQFLQLTSSAGRIIKMMVVPTAHATLAPGTLLIQDFAGATLDATPLVMGLDTPYHFWLGAQPGSTTSNGKARAWVYSDDEALLYTLDNTNVTGGNIDAVNMGTTQNVLEVVVGDPATTGGAPLDISWTRLAIDTGATIPTSMPVVDKITPPGSGETDGFGGELVWVGDSWL